jgi:hypothetical protein
LLLTVMKERDRRFNNFEVLHLTIKSSEEREAQAKRVLGRSKKLGDF